MARKAGLPDHFDLKVSREELVQGPARLPGYLDRTGIKIVPTVDESQGVSPAEKAEEPRVTAARIVASSANVTAAEKPEPSFEATTEEKTKVVKAPIRIRRLQVNLSADAQLMVQELVEQICVQSPEKGINYSDVIQGLIIKLYESRSEIDVSQLPLRGRWGSPTARSFAKELASVFGKAIKDTESQNGDLFQKVVGA